MANITDTMGTFTFDSNFYKENKDLIDIYFENAILGSSYGIFSITNNYNGVFGFQANGRWSMQNTLKWCLTPLNAPSKLLFNQLFNKMKTQNQTVTFDYEDYDPAMNWREHDTAIIAPATSPKPKEDYYFDIINITTEDLPTDEFSLLDSGLEDGINVEDANDTTYPVIHDIIIKLVTFLNNDPHKQNYKIKTVEDKFFDYINNSPDYQGAFLNMHYDDDDNLKDWYDDEFSKLFK